MWRHTKLRGTYFTIATVGHHAFWFSYKDSLQASLVLPSEQWEVLSFEQVSVTILCLGDTDVSKVGKSQSAWSRCSREAHAGVDRKGEMLLKGGSPVPTETLQSIGSKAEEWPSILEVWDDSHQLGQMWWLQYYSEAVHIREEGTGSLQRNTLVGPFPLIPGITASELRSFTQETWGLSSHFVPVKNSERREESLVSLKWKTSFSTVLTIWETFVFTISSSNKFPSWSIAGFSLSKEIFNLCLFLSDLMFALDSNQAVMGYTNIHQSVLKII